MAKFGQIRSHWFLDENKIKLNKPTLAKFIHCSKNILWYRSTYLLTYFLLTYLPTYLLTYLTTYLPSYLPTYLPTYLPSYLPTYLSTYLPSYLPTFLPAYLPKWPNGNAKMKWNVVSSFHSFKINKNKLKWT